MNEPLVWAFAYWGWVASEVYVLSATRTRRGGGKVKDRGSLAVQWVVICTAMTVCEWYRRYAGPDSLAAGGNWLKFAGLFLLLAGLSVRWWAIRTLGKAFSANVAIRESQKVCKEGLYRLLRHPSYTGLELIFVGVGLHSQNWVSFVAAVVPATAAVLYRIHVEEMALREAFGEEYMAYSTQTKRLVPGIY